MMPIKYFIEKILRIIANTLANLVYAVRPSDANRRYSDIMDEALKML